MQTVAKIRALCVCPDLSHKHSAVKASDGGCMYRPEVATDEIAIKGYQTNAVCTLGMFAYWKSVVG